MADIDTDVTDETQPEEVTIPSEADEPKDDDDKGETEGETNDQENEAANDKPSAEDENEGEENTEAEHPVEEDDQPTARDDDEPADENVDEAADFRGVDDSEERGDVTADENVTGDNNEADDDQLDERTTKSPVQGEEEGNEDAEETSDDKQGDSNNTEEAFTLSDEDRNKCRRLFDKKATNDRLNLAGLKAVFRLMGQVLSSSEADQIFEEADKDGDDTVDFEEFCRLYSKYGQEEETRKSVLLDSVDKLFKCNQDGEVDLSEVEQVLLKLQQPGPNSKLVREKSDLGPEDIRSLVKAMDRDGNGRISKKEFVQTLCQHIEG